MSKVKTILIVAVLIMVLASCSKDNTASPGGYWTFKANTYQGLSCVGNIPNATLTATNTVSGSTYSNVVVTFPGSLPSDTGTYLVSYAGSLPAAKHVSIVLAYATPDTLIYYTSTGGNTKNQKVFVNVKNGKLEVVGTGIEMLNTTGSIDSAALSLDITQTQ